MITPLVSVLLLCCAFLEGNGSRAGLPVSGTQDHLWFILGSAEEDGKELGWSLAHHGSRDTSGEYRLVRRLQQQPTALASLEGNLWITLAPEVDRPQLVPVRLLRLQWNEGIEGYLPQPRQGFDLLPSIESTGAPVARTIDLVATLSGPAALLEHADGTLSIH